MHRRHLLAGLFAAPAVVALPVQARTIRSTPDETLDAVFASTAPPALGGAMVTRTGLSWSGVRGVRQAGGDQPVTLEDRWHIGSNTKAMTAAVFARLVEARRADWDMTVADAFPDLTLDPAWSATPLTTLMRHRSGLADADVIGLNWLSVARSDPRSLPGQRMAIAAAAMGRPPSGTPGRFAYSNAGYIIVGAAIEAITGEPWEDVTRAQLFQPLGVSGGGFGPPPDPNAWGHRAAGARHLPVSPSNPGADNPLALGPAGTAHMTLADNALWMQAMLGGGPQGWLGADSLARLTTTTEIDPAYALGWITRPAPAAGDGIGRTIGHEGSNTMWHAMVVAAPDRGLGFIACSNDATKGAAACRQLVQGLMAVASSA